MKKWWMGVLTTLLLGVIVWGVNFAVDPARFPLASVQVEGRFHHLSRQQLERAVAEQIRGSFFQIDLDAVRDGVLNLPWVAVLTIVVLAEKVLPYGRYLSRGLGVGLIAWGLWLFAAS